MPIDPLGMESGLITADQMSFSSSKSSSDPDGPRLNQGFWTSVPEDLNPWFQIKFLRKTKVTGMQIRGRRVFVLGIYNRYLTKTYKVGVSENGISWENVTDGNGDEEVCTLRLHFSYLSDEKSVAINRSVQLIFIKYS